MASEQCSVLFQQYTAAREKIYPFLAQYVPELPEHKMLILVDGTFRVTGIPAPPGGFANPDEVERTVDAAVAKVPEAVRAMRKGSMLMSKTVALGTYLAAFKSHAKDASLRDDTIRDFVRDVTPAELMIHAVTRMDQIYDFFRPNVGCISTGSGYYGSPAGKAIWTNTGHYFCGWILGVENVVPYYATFQGTPICRFFHETKDDQLFYMRSEYRPQLEESLGKLMKDLFPKYDAKKPIPYGWSSYSHKKIKLPEFTYRDRQVLCTGTMDGASTHILYLDPDGVVYSVRDQNVSKGWTQVTGVKGSRVNPYGYEDRFSFINRAKATWERCPDDFLSVKG